MTMTMTIRLKLLTDDRLNDLTKYPTEDAAEVQIIAAELKEYRKLFGPLGCEWLEIESQ